MARQMKDSGVEWIGEIPEEWEITKIKNKVELINGYAFDSSSLKREGKYSVIRIGDISSGTIDINQANKIDYEDAAIDKYLIKEDDVVIAMSGATVGKLGYVNKISGKCYINQRVGIIRSKISRYVFYYLGTGEFLKYITLLAAGSAQPNISTENINNYFISIPSAEKEIIKIADFLDEKVGEIDSVITKTKETIEDYKKYKQAIITDAVTKGLNPNVEMKESGIAYLKSIPCNWGVIPISIAFNFIGGYAYKSDRFCGKTPYQVIRLGNVKNDNFIIDEKCVFIDEEYAKESEKSKIYKDDILFTMTGTRGKKDYFYTLIVKDKDLQKRALFLNQRVGCFRKAIDQVFMPYYNYLLKYENICDYIFLSETGTANQGNIGIESINTTKLLLPPLEEQRKIVEYLDEKCSEIDKLVAKKEELLEDLESYKKSLIYEYVTGKKEV